MKTVGVKLLVTVCLVAVALPPGWCCTIGSGGCCRPTGALASTPANVPTACSCCEEMACCCKPKAAPAEPDKSAPKPAPKQHTCECSSPHSQRVPTPVEVPPDAFAGLVVLLPAPTCINLALAYPVEADTGPPVLPDPQVLHCLWLC